MKDPLILLPGMMCDARVSEPQVAEFSAHRSIMVAALTGRSTIASLVSDLLAGFPPRFALAGLSMGGIVAMEILRQAPSRVTRLALCDTNHLPEASSRAQERNNQIERVRHGGLEHVMREEMKPHYLAEGPSNGRILDLCMRMAKALGSDVFIQQSMALQHRVDQQDTLRKVRVPTLFLCGAHDTLCPVERHQQMQELVPGSQLAVIEGAGHLPTLEQPQRTNKALQEWLKT